MMSSDDSKPLERRDFLKMLAGGGLLSMFLGLDRVSAQSLIRPPGALPEEEFLSLCTRCGKCAQVCPQGSIDMAHADTGLADIGTPYMRLATNPCNLCMKCTEICPSGALRQIPKDDVRMGTAWIDTSLCYARHDDDCQICYRGCPQYGKAIKLEKYKYPVVDPTYCTGCGTCENICPAAPKAIHVYVRGHTPEDGGEI